MKGLGWRAGLIAVVVVVAAYFMIPPKERINLGLDLQGGMHLVLEVEAEKAVTAKIDRYFGEIKDRLVSDDIRTRSIKREGRQVIIGLHRDSDRAKLGVLMGGYSDLALQSSEGDPPVFVYSYPDEVARQTMDQAIDQALETIRNRIDQFGVREPTLQRQGERRILIQLPGIKGPSRAKALIGKTAVLEFKIVDPNADTAQAEKTGAPEGLELIYQITRDKTTGEIVRRRPVLVKKEASLTGDNLTNARVEIGDRFSEPSQLH